LGARDLPELIRRFATISAVFGNLLADAWRLRMRYRPQDDPSSLLLLMFAGFEWVKNEAIRQAASNEAHEPGRPSA
jgi:hypothetical protein